MKNRHKLQSSRFKFKTSKQPFKYTNKCINRIINEVSIVDVIGDLFMRPIQRTNKSNYYLNVSPFDYLDEPFVCKLTGKPFICSTDKRMFKCFHTGISGNVINFVQYFLNTNKKGAITWILYKYGMHRKDIQERKMVKYNNNVKHWDRPF